LNIQDENIIDGTGSFTLNSGGTLGVGSVAGLFSAGASGNIRTTTRTFNSGGNLRYWGSANQSTGSLLTTPTTNTLAGMVIDNPQTVTLAATNNGLNLSNLTLSQGRFNVGAGQTINMVANGTIILLQVTSVPAMLPAPYSF
jgi:hypothetical protein